jgi:hypothetical protein
VADNGLGGAIVTNGGGGGGVDVLGATFTDNEAGGSLG